MLRNGDVTWVICGRCKKVGLEVFLTEAGRDPISIKADIVG